MLQIEAKVESLKLEAVTEAEYLRRRGSAEDPNPRGARVFGDASVRSPAPAGYGSATGARN